MWGGMSALNCEVNRELNRVGIGKIDKKRLIFLFRQSPKDTHSYCFHRVDFKSVPHHTLEIYYQDPQYKICS